MRASAVLALLALAISAAVPCEAGTFADSIVWHTQPSKPSDLKKIIGPPDGASGGNVCYDDIGGRVPGLVVVSFGGKVFRDRPGPDIIVHVYDFHPDEPSESFEVYASLDGHDWRRLGGRNPAKMTVDGGRHRTIPFQFDLADGELEKARLVMVVNGTIDAKVRNEGPNLDAVELVEGPKEEVTPEGIVPPLATSTSPSSRPS